jgi:LysM repeat protein
LLSKSELDTLGRTSKANAQREQKMQKQRKFAKGEGKLPIKERVGTKAEYKQLGKDIQTRTKLIAYGKAARAAQAERAANPAPAKKATLSKATPAKAATPVAKKTTPKTKATPKVMPKPTPKVTPKATLKASTAAIKKRTSPNTKAKPTLTSTTKKQLTPKPKPMAKPALKTKAPLKPTLKRVMQGPTGVGTSSEYKALAAEKKTRAALTKKSGEIAKGKTIAGKIAKKTAPLKNALTNSKTVTTAKKVANTSLAKDVAKGAQGVAGKIKKIGGSKFLKVGGKLVKIGQVVSVAKEVADVAGGQAEKDFRSIQALENRIAKAKGKPIPYKKVGSNRNLIQSGKVDFGNAVNILTVGLAGKSRKERLTELRGLVKNAEKNPVVKTGGKKTTTFTPSKATKGDAGKAAGARSLTITPSTKGKSTTSSTSGNKYRVQSGDTLSGIAARAGVSLTALRSANPQIKDPRKIYRNTGVVIPKSGKVPTGGYVKKVK